MACSALCGTDCILYPVFALPGEAAWTRGQWTPVLLALSGIFERGRLFTLGIPKDEVWREYS